MTYAASNPPAMLVQRVGDGPAIWAYVDGDAIAEVDTEDYFSNAGDLGMATNDVIFVVNTASNLVTIGQITVDSDGNGTVTALTAVP